MKITANDIENVLALKFDVDITPAAANLILPEVQEPNLLWPGWNTEDVSADAFPETSLTLRVLDLRGPDM